MKRIKVSDSTYRAIAAAAIGAFRPTGERQADGSWLVPVDDEVHQRLQELRLPGEIDDDVVVRMIHVYHNRPNN